jgi:hypothetical protein
MSWSLNIGKVAGTVVRLHITFVPFLAWIFVSNYASSVATIAWNSLLGICRLPSQGAPCCLGRLRPAHIAVTARHSRQLLIQYLYPTPAES